MAKKYEYLRATYRQAELLDNLREEGANGWELCSATARKQDKYVNVGTSNMQYVSVEMYVDCIFKREKEAVVEKEFVWTEERVQELLWQYSAFPDPHPSLLKFIENFKSLKHSIPAGKGTANDVLNTEEKKKAIKSWIDFMPEGIDPREATANDVLNTEEEKRQGRPKNKWADDLLEKKAKTNIDFSQPQNTKERITVTIFNDGLAGERTSIRPNKSNWAIPKEKNSEIKAAIEKILNHE